MKIFRRKMNSHIAAVRKSILFDERHILKYEKIPSHVDVAQYYLENWRKMQTNPSPFFDSHFYTSIYTDISASGYNPLLHYILFGWKEVRAPSPHFDRAGFLASHKHIDEKRFDPASCCLMLYGDYNWKEKLDVPHTHGSGVKAHSFQELLLNPEIDAACRAIFNQDFYVSTYSDIKAANIDPYYHFMNFGFSEDRDPAPLFDTHYYRRTNLADSSSENPLVHYVTRGKSLKLPTHSRNLELLAISKQRIETKLSICVHVHCYYPEVIGEVCKGILNFPNNTHIVATVCQVADKFFLEKFFRKHLFNYSFEVRLVPNRGRDIAPFLVEAYEIWKNFDLVLHIHTKNSRHVSWGRTWREYLFDQLMGSKEIVEAIVERFENETALGAYYPSNFYEIKKFIASNPNKEIVESTSRYLDVQLTSSGLAEFAAGSMCWYRARALSGVAAKINSLELFEQEAGQVDGTLAHALERLLPAAVSSSDYIVRSYSMHVRASLGQPLSTPARDSTDAVVTDAWPRDTPRAAKRPKLPLSPASKSFNPKALDIHWIVPSFGQGAGGHMTIFRMISFLEKFGHRQTVWLQNATNMPNQEVAKRRICDWYAEISLHVHVLFLPEDLRQLSGDVIIATDCWTAFPVSRATKFKERFYFVQDLEPEFHPAGGNRLVAESTYDFGFSALCAGSWLHEKMQQKGLWSRQWDLSADGSIYFGDVERVPSNEFQIAFYARPYTARRAVELGYAAFEQLAARGLRFRVHLFGEENLDVRYDFPHVQHGILTHEQLAELYRSSDIGVVFSATNYSLIPLEMAASGLPVVELDVPSTRAIFKNDEVAFAEPTPYGIASTIEDLLNDAERRKAQSFRAIKFVQQNSWEKSARKIESALIERLEELDFQSIEPISIAAPAVTSKSRVSVFIPTYNAGPEFKNVLNTVLAQKCNFKFEVLVVDSESTDDTPENVKTFAHRGVRFEQIKKESFQHGRTRNLGISMSDGDYVAIITQDALPKNDRWLSSLIDGFGRGTHVAGVTGRHEAYPAHGSFVARDMNEHFDNLALLPEVVDLDIGLPSNYHPGGIPWRMLVNFYSDNNSAISKRVWKSLPYPEVDWGEDYVWASMALKAGFQKVYADDAVVYHSHDFQDSVFLKTATTEGRFWGSEFGISLYDNEKVAIDALDARDRAYAAEWGIGKGDVAKRLRTNKLLVRGRVRGYLNSLE